MTEKGTEKHSEDMSSEFGHGDFEERSPGNWICLECERLFDLFDIPD